MAIELEDAIVLARAVKDEVLESLRIQGVFQHKEQRPPEDRRAALAAAREVLKEAISRLLTKESKAAERLLNGNVDADAWIKTFYEKHLSLAERSLFAPALLLRSLGLDCDAPAEASILCSRSAEELLNAYNTESPARLKARLESWPTDRSERETARIMGESR